MFELHNQRLEFYHVVIQRISKDFKGIMVLKAIETAEES